jgi:hypothetical protein
MMPGLAMWQKVLHYGGQLAILIGAIWSLYVRFQVQI